MLKAEENEILTRVGPGTLMGELLRCYWTPACLTAEIPDPGGAPARVRLLGENLVVYRDSSGKATGAARILSHWRHSRRRYRPIPMASFRAATPPTMTT
jgi:phthalate 4,5-dioxygenase oxygenase subunit